MTDLTDKWKKGELPFGYYYVKFLNDKEGVKKLGEYAYRKLIKEVIDIVPSYEEWQETLQALDAAHKAIKMEDETINRLVSSGKQCNYENTKLKELLKECKTPLKVYNEMLNQCLVRAK